MHDFMWTRTLQTRALAQHDLDAGHLHVAFYVRDVRNAASSSIAVQGRMIEVSARIVVRQRGRKGPTTAASPADEGKI